MIQDTFKPVTQCSVPVRWKVSEHHQTRRVGEEMEVRRAEWLLEIAQLDGAACCLLPSFPFLLDLAHKSVASKTAGPT